MTLNTDTEKYDAFQKQPPVRESSLVFAGRYHLRLKITVAVSVLVVACMFTIACVMLSTFEKTLKSSISEDQFLLVTALAGEIDKRITAAQQQLISATENLSQETFNDFEKADSFLSCMLGLRKIFDNQISLITPEGRIFAEYPVQKGRLGRDVSHRDYFKATTALQSPVISEPYVSSLSPYHPTIMMTVPLLDKNGRLVGILAGAMDLMGSNILNDISKITIGRSGYLFLLTGDTRMMIMHPDDMRIMKPISSGVNALLDRALGGFEGTGETINSYGNRMLTSFKHLTTTGWVLGANYPIAEAHDTLKKLQLIFFVSAVSGVLFIIAVVYFLVKYLTRPLVAFTHHLATFSDKPHEEKFFRLRTNDEIDTLSSAFNELIDQLDQQTRALQKSEEKYRTIYNASSNAIFIQDIETGAILDVNQKMCEMYRIDYQDALKANVGDLSAGIPPYTLQDALALVAKAAQGQQQLFEWQAQDTLGRIFWVLVKMRVVEIDGVKRLLVTVSDISKRKEAERALRESEERFSKAFRSSPAPVIISDIATGRIVDVNDRWLAMMEYSRTDINDKSTLELGMWPNIDVRRQMVQQLLRDGRLKDYSCQIRTKSGNILDVTWYAEIIKLGELDFVLSLIYDNTEKKRSEEERQKLQAQLLQAQKMESIGRLAGGVAHDYNNMLGVIIGHVELASQKVRRAYDVEKHLNEILKAAKRSAELTQQLLAFARRQNIAPKILDLNQAVGSILDMVHVLLGEDIELTWLPGSGSYFVKIDPTQLNQLLMNLCVNARDAIAEKGKITIETQKITIDESYCALNTFFVAGDFIVLIVSDNGHGMDKETQSKIFEPFFTTKETGKGTGLGLATVYGIVKQNNGFINVYSELGNGTTFKIYFPTCKDIEKENLKPLLPTFREGSPKTILLVEDEPALLEINKAALMELGHVVLAADTPENAVQLAKEHAEHLDLLITDVMMPQMNGQDLERHIRQLCPEIRCLFASGYTASVISHHVLLDNDVHLIQKPFTLKELQAKISECLGGNCKTKN